MKFLHQGLLLLLLFTACARSNPAAAPSPEVPRPATPVASAAPRNWSLTPDEDLHSYASKATTTLQLQQETGVVRDSFAIALDFSIRIQRGTELPRITGTLDRFQRNPEVRSTQTELPVILPFSFTGSMRSGGLVLDSAGGRVIAIVADCESAGLNQMGVIQRNLSLVPLMLRTGATWTDSSTVTTCSGAVPVQLTAIRTYTVTGETQAPDGTAIMLERSERTRATGEGALGQHRVGLQASGTGTARLYLEPASGLLRLSEGESRTTVTIRSSGRLQTFVQVVKERTVRIR